LFKIGQSCAFNVFTENCWVLEFLLDSDLGAQYNALLSGAIAQLGERLHGMQEVGGSIPPSSTAINSLFVLSPSSRGLGHYPFTVVTRVRIPSGTPSFMCKDKELALN